MTSEVESGAASALLFELLQTGAAQGHLIDWLQGVDKQALEFIGDILRLGVERQPAVQFPSFDLGREPVALVQFTPLPLADDRLVLCLNRPLVEEYQRQN